MPIKTDKFYDSDYLSSGKYDKAMSDNPQYSHLDTEINERIQRFTREECKAAIRMIRERLNLFERQDYYLSIPIASLPLSVRAYNATRKKGLETVRDLMILEPDSLYILQNVGVQTISEIKSLIRKIAEHRHALNGMKESELREFLKPS